MSAIFRVVGYGRSKRRISCPFSERFPWEQVARGTEGIVFISAEESPDGNPLVVVANTVSGNTTIHEVRQR